MFGAVPVKVTAGTEPLVTAPMVRFEGVEPPEPVVSARPPTIFN
jgi:hypothetical protein